MSEQLPPYPFPSARLDYFFLVLLGTLGSKPSDGDGPGGIGKPSPNWLREHGYIREWITNGPQGSRTEQVD